MSAIEGTCQLCGLVLSAASPELVLFALQQHSGKEHKTTETKKEQVSTTERDNLPKVEKASGEMSLEEWLGVEHDWKVWKKNLNKEIPDYTQFLRACFPKIRREISTMERQEGEDVIWTEEELTRTIKKIMVAYTNVATQRQTFYKIRQQYNESAREFHRRLVNTAETCNFRTKCKVTTCTAKYVSFKDEMIRDAILLGIHDSYIQQRAIAACNEQPEDDEYSSQQLIEFVANIENAQ